MNISKLIKCNIKTIGIISIIIVIIVVVVTLVIKRLEKFEDLTLPEDKLLMITDAAGNIQTLPISSLNKYLKSIETEITSNKTNMTSYLTDLSRVTSNIDTVKNNALQKGTKYNVKIGTNFNTTSLFN